MSWKNRGTTARRLQASTNASINNHYCLLSFPLEGTHGIWPHHLIRSKGNFSFEVKYGTQWFECRIEKEGEKNVFSHHQIHYFLILGNIDECKLAESSMEKSLPINSKQWSSAETELSEEDDDDEDV